MRADAANASERKTGWTDYSRIKCVAEFIFAPVSGEDNGWYDADAIASRRAAFQRVAKQPDRAFRVREIDEKFNDPARPAPRAPILVVRVK